MQSTQHLRDYLGTDQSPKASIEVQRTAEHTRKYAEACRGVGDECKVAVLDLWLSFMTEVGWKSGQPLPGSKEQPICHSLQDLLSDGLQLQLNS